MQIPLLTKRNQLLVNRQNSKVNIPDEPNYIEGGQWLVDATLKYGVNDKGERLRITPGLIEVLRLIGDFRIKSTYTSGCAQCYKSVTMWQLICGLTTIGRKDALVIFPQLNIIHTIVPTQFKKIIGKWEEQLGLFKKVNTSDSKSTTIHQGILGTAKFSPANSNTNVRAESGLASANPNLVSARLDVMICDERSNCDSKALDVARRRLLQSRIPTRPERTNGTPGNGGGIELEISKATYQFEAHIKCSDCGEIHSLSPIGCLLIPDKDGEYFDGVGRPVNWHHKDPINKLASAFFACPNCSYGITKEARLNAKFRCIKTGVWLSDLLDDLPKEWPLELISAGITLSPLLRDMGLNPPVEIITKGLEDVNVSDWHQQELGIPTKYSNTGITIDNINTAIKTILPERPYDLRVWGLDQGTKEHWIVVVDYRLPNNYRELSEIQIYEKTHRNIIIAKPINVTDLDYMVRNYDGGCLDNEPSRDFAAAIVKKYDKVFAFDQRGSNSLSKLISKPGVVEAGGKPMNVVLCNTDRIQDYILALFNSKKITISCLADATNMDNKMIPKHFTTSTKDPETGKWNRPSDHVDDLLKAFMGAELWFYLHCTGMLPNDGVSLSDLI